MKITNNCVVEIAYKMNFVGDEDIIEEFSERNPLEFLVGMGEMLPFFEEQLLGKRAGDNIEFVIDKNEAFGEFDDNLVMNLSKEMFLDSHGKFNEDIIKEGSVITLDIEDTESQDAYVIEVVQDEVLVDMNHPFAGENLHYQIMVLSVRLAE